MTEISKAEHIAWHRALALSRRDIRELAPAERELLDAALVTLRRFDAVDAVTLMVHLSRSGLDPYRLAPRDYATPARPVDDSLPPSRAAR
jgi:hypothetical protein